MDESPTSTTSAESRRSAKLSRLLAPNFLTVARLVLGCCFPFLPLAWRLPVLLYGAVSDLVDGVVSRYLHGTSVFGRVLDPIADKVFVFGVLIALLADGELKLWELVLLGTRDFAVTGLLIWGVARRQWHLARRSPSPLGKICTGAQFAFLLGLLLVPKWPGLSCLFWATVVLSAAAAVDYVRGFVGHSPGPAGKQGK